IHADSRSRLRRFNGEYNTTTMNIRIMSIWLSVYLAHMTLVPNAFAAEPEKPHPDAARLAKLIGVAAGAKLQDGKFDETTRRQLAAALNELTDKELRKDVEKLLPALESAAQRCPRDRALLAEIKRLGGKATVEVVAPERLRSILGDDSLTLFGRI